MLINRPERLGVLRGLVYISAQAGSTAGRPPGFTRFYARGLDAKGAAGAARRRYNRRALAGEGRICPQHLVEGWSSAPTSGAGVSFPALLRGPRRTAILRQKIKLIPRFSLRS